MAKRYAGVRRLADIDWTTWQPVHHATLTFVVDGDRVLLIRKKRGLGAGKINGPGGKLDAGELPEACAIRECREEVGITPADLWFAGENRFQFTDGYSIQVHTFVAGSYEGSPVETDEAIPFWQPMRAIPYEEMWADDRLWLPHALAGRRIDGRWIFEGDTFLDYELAIDGLPVAAGR